MQIISSSDGSDLKQTQVKISLILKDWDITDCALGAIHHY